MHYNNKSISVTHKQRNNITLICFFTLTKLQEDCQIQWEERWNSKTDCLSYNITSYQKKTCAVSSVATTHSHTHIQT